MLNPKTKSHASSTLNINVEMTQLHKSSTLSSHLMAQHRKKARYSLFQPLVLPSIRSSDQLTSFEPSLAVPLHLPPTPSIIPQLLNMGCTLAESEELSEYLNSVITEFRSTCQFDYESAWRGIARLSSWDDLQRIAGGVRNVLRHHYSKQVKSWEELVFEFVRKRAERATLNSHRRPAFNTVCSFHLIIIILQTLMRRESGMDSLLEEMLCPEPISYTP